MKNTPAPSLNDAFGPQSNRIDFDIDPADNAPHRASSMPYDGGHDEQEELDESLPVARLINNLDANTSLDLEQWLAHRHAELRLFAGGVRRVVGRNATGTAAEFDREFSEFCRALAAENRQ